jgi:hypothetical protein
MRIHRNALSVLLEHPRTIAVLRRRPPQRISHAGRRALGPGRLVSSWTTESRFRLSARYHLSWDLTPLQHLPSKRSVHRNPLERKRSRGRCAGFPSPAVCVSAVSTALTLCSSSRLVKAPSRAPTTLLGFPPEELADQGGAWHHVQPSPHAARPAEPGLHRYLSSLVLVRHPTRRRPGRPSCASGGYSPRSVPHPGHHPGVRVFPMLCHPPGYDMNDVGPCFQESPPTRFADPSNTTVRAFVDPGLSRAHRLLLAFQLESTAPRSLYPSFCSSRPFGLDPPSWVSFRSSATRD